MLTYRPYASIPLATTVVGMDGAPVDFVRAGYAAGDALTDPLKGKVVVSVQDRLSGDVAVTSAQGAEIPLENVAMYCGASTTEAVVTITEGLPAGRYIATIWYVKSDSSGAVLERCESDIEFDVAPAAQSVPPPETN